MTTTLVINSVVVLAATGFVFWFGVPAVWGAIKTGEIRSQTGLYRRRERPGMFYFALAVWLFMFALMATGSIAIFQALGSAR
jgi:hypothetical protein